VQPAFLRALDAGAATSNLLVVSCIQIGHPALDHVLDAGQVWVDRIIRWSPAWRPGDAGFAVHDIMVTADRTEHDRRGILHAQNVDSCRPRDERRRGRNWNFQKPSRFALSVTSSSMPEAM
jgi:hypothetical protein